MIGAVFNALVYAPLYNGLVFLVGVFPTHDIGLAVITLTILVRIILYPLSRRVIESQKAMKKIAPEVEEIKQKHKKNSAEQTAAIMKLYRDRGVHPFASFGLTLLQLPILFGLYWVFLRGGFPHVNPGELYSFVHVPPEVDMRFLGFVDMGASHNVVLALLVVLTQFLYTRLSMGPREKTPEATPVEASLSGDMAKSFDLQARYAFPVIFGIVSYAVSAAAPLYWVTSNTFMIGQEFFAGRSFWRKR